jgi:hypothetical protein
MTSCFLEAGLFAAPERGPSEPAGQFEFCDDSLSRVNGPRVVPVAPQASPRVTFLLINICCLSERRAYFHLGLRGPELRANIATRRPSRLFGRQGVRDRERDGNSVRMFERCATRRRRGVRYFLLPIAFSSGVRRAPGSEGSEEGPNQRLPAHAESDRREGLPSKCWRMRPGNATESRTGRRVNPRQGR